MKMYDTVKGFSYSNSYLDNGEDLEWKTLDTEFITNLDLQYADNCFLKIICTLNMILVANLDVFQYLGIHVQFFR